MKTTERRNNLQETVSIGSKSLESFLSFIQLKSSFTRNVTDSDPPTKGIDGVHRTFPNLRRQFITFHNASRPNCRRSDINTSSDQRNTGSVTPKSGITANKKRGFRSQRMGLERRFWKVGSTRLVAVCYSKEACGYGRHFLIAWRSCKYFSWFRF